jgi:hypothetical protein
MEECYQSLVYRNASTGRMREETNESTSVHVHNTIYYGECFD